MKKYMILFSAAIALTTVACTKEEFNSSKAVEQKPVRTLVCSFEDVSTKTDITRHGKTVWAEGDKILVTNGREKDTLTVSKEFSGSKYYEFSTTLTDTLYLCYPLQAFNSLE